MLIRDEQGRDEHAIRQLVADAVRDHPRSDRSEHFLVDALRRSGALTLSLIAEVGGAQAGYIAFSPVRIGGVFQDWYGLGPVAVDPPRQGSGIGQALWYEADWSASGRSAPPAALLGDPG